MPAPQAIPDSWTHLDKSSAPYEKLVKRDAYEIPNLNGDGDTNDLVILINGPLVGVTKGPVHRVSWTVPDSHAAAERLARVIDAWIHADRESYGRPCLKEQLTLAVTTGVTP